MLDLELAQQGESTVQPYNVGETRYSRYGEVPIRSNHAHKCDF